MTPTIDLAEAGFAYLAPRDEQRQSSDAMRVAQACALEEILGVVFGSITLWYLVSSLAALV